ncbi:DNA repair exonuclease [Staphylococcus succinus]|uniref:DNA repair exonuclease n=1 Tax=Staphylococcus succinus TaxID=61015 RepID=A0ABX5IQR0_9STAP|nr:DNA repair exonuclease [Staphylococcus succinus]MBU0438064.1 metallophosphoesterase [Staphylococcus succinus]MEB7461112.1 metallophosphoesterase [Staphylococcus succinus]PKI23544.1 DNA repair exonuclease [Staphylococcus succinus]PTI47256.1 DNA repair exonuclease [Staphylococcus succinus]PTI69181.1 DNA repair exonuclease [Staphylococcus succinus]
MVKFIHCADLHLDSPFKSRSYLSQSIFDDMQKSAYESFEKIIDLALNEEIDFMIISGDLFDQQNRTLRAEVFLKKQFERLAKEQIFVYICHGNHDPLSAHVATEWPDNVSVFSENVETYQTITKNGEEIYLHGFSYQNDASYENKLDAYPSSQGQKGIHIGILHGTYSKTNTQNRYTEFRLEDLNNKLYHYWALGHIHERQQLSDMPQIHYPGNIQGRHFKELGEKGCLLVEGDNLNLHAQFVPTQFIRFEQATIETDKTTKQGLFDEIQNFKAKVRTNGKSIYQLNVILNSDVKISEQDIIQIHDMVSDYEENEHQFVFIEDLNIRNKHEEQNTLVNEFSPELIEDNTVYDQAMNDLYLNPKASKYLENYSNFDRRALIEHAEELLKSDMRGE